MSEGKSALGDRAYGTENGLVRGLTFIAALGGLGDDARVRTVMSASAHLSVGHAIHRHPLPALLI
jgi:hypothetical protein